MSEVRKPIAPADAVLARRRIASRRFLAVVGGVLGAGGVVVVGAWVHPMLAFVLLPVALGFGARMFVRAQARRAQPARWPALIAGNGLVLAFLVSLIFLGCESYYRFCCDQTDAMVMTLVSTAWRDRHFHLNATGVRDDINYTNTLSPGIRRVTFVGDSFTAGYGVNDVADRFVNRIRRLHPEWEVHAMAKPGLDTSTELELMHRLTVSNSYRLDQVVLVYQINDIGELMPGWVAGYQRMLADRFRQGWLCQHSYFVNLVYLHWLRQRSAYLQEYYDEVESAYRGPLWETEKIGLNAFANMVQLQGGRLLVVTFPFLDQGARFQPVHQQLDRYWKERGVPHLDLLPVFAPLPAAQVVANPNDSHPNAYAHALAAEAINAFLQREISPRTPGATPAPQ